MLHKNKITLEKHVLFTYICCRKSLGQLQYHNIIWISSSFTQGIRHSTDIATIRVSFCNKYMYKTQHIFHVRFYVDAAQQSFLQSKSINLKTRTWMSINLKTIHIWCGLTLYQTLSWMQTVSQWLIFTVWMLWCTFCNNSHLMTKPTKWHVRQAKTQISLGIRPVWSVFAVRMKKHRVLSYPLSAQRRLIRLGGCQGWSESLLGAHSFSWFCHEAVHVFSFQTLFYQLHHWNRSLYISFFRHCLLGQKCLS